MAAWVAPAIQAGASVLGGLLGGGGKTQSAESYLDIPDWLQQDVSSIANEGRQRLLERDPMATTDMVASLNPNLAAAFTQLADYGGGTGGQILQQLLGMTGEGGVVNQGQDLLMGAANRGPSVNSGLDMGKVGEIANNPFMDDMIQAALRDPARALTEQQLPAARMAQAISGNTGSTRGAIGEAVLQRGFDDRAADVSAALRGSAYNTGLGIEANRAGQNAALDSDFSQLMASIGGNLVQSGGMEANIMNLANSIGLGNIQALMGAGTGERAVEQEFKDADIYNYNQPVTDLLSFASLINPMAEQYGTRHGTASSSGNSGASQALAALSTFMGSLNSGGGGGSTSYTPSGFNSATNFIDTNFDILPRQ